VADIQSCDEIFYGYFYEDTLAGFVSFKMDEEEVDIHRLVVSPDHFHKGIATKLLLYVFDMFSPSKTYIVQTGKENTPALSLYKKHGFIEVKDNINKSMSQTICCFLIFQVKLKPLHRVI
ncbi:GNAT family N-acetyltransferase, partial [Bacillus sp. B-TM1]